MRAVSRFEANLLRVLQALLRRAPLEPALTVLSRKPARPACLSQDAVELLQDTLAKGCVHLLARRGWRRERFLRGDNAVEGRLWQRSPPTDLALTFSAHALEFLLQLQTSAFTRDVPSITDLTLGDRFLFVLALDALREHAPGQALVDQWRPLHQDGLARLAFPDRLMDLSRVDWLPWMSGPGASILEALQGWLADRWVQAERQKLSAGSIARVQKMGATQQRIYREYLDALDAASRRDLARGFLEAIARALRERPGARAWLGSIDLQGVRLADRAAVHRDAFALLLQMDRLNGWQQQALGVGYFDEGYQASQLWKAEWERWGGDMLVETARTIMREVDPMR